MDKFFYAVIEIQINDGVPAATPVVIKDKLSDAQGELFVKMGYAYQHPRDYTEVIVIDQSGNIPVDVNPVIIDNREDVTVPVFSLTEIQINDTDPVATPVNVQVGDEAESIIMQAYHNSLSYAWNVKRPYTLCYAAWTFGAVTRKEAVDYTPQPNTGDGVLDVPSDDEVSEGEGKDEEES